jgi:ATP-binding cassette, subfamily B, bacterial
MKTVCRVFAYLKRYPLLAIATLACAIAGTLMVVVPPTATKYVLDNVINGHHPERLLPLLVLVGFAMLLQRGLDYLRLLLNNTFEQKIIFDLRRDLYSHIQTLPLRWFDNRATGDLMTRILEEVS